MNTNATLLAVHLRHFLEAANVRDSEVLAETPLRAAKAFLEMTSGYEVNVPELFTTFEEQYDEIVVVKDIEFHSMCEHHLLPFHGTASVGYIPNGRVVGLSKLARVVDAYARRLQLQERMSREIADALETHLRPRGVSVVIEASHMCMCARGVRKPGAVTVTSTMRGVFRDTKAEPEARLEVLSLMGYR